jgi:hypothetical protein
MDRRAGTWSDYRSPMCGNRCERAITPGSKTIRKERGMKRVWIAMVPVLMFLAACEDEGNAGDDNLLTGGSLVLVLIVVAIVALVLFRRRR